MDTKTKIIAQGKRRIEQIQNQYEERILHLLKGRLVNQLSDTEKVLYDILIQSSLFDPRRPDVGYGKEEMVIKGNEIGKRLDALSPAEFLTDDYVIEWREHLGDGMKITNLPIQTE